MPDTVSWRSGSGPVKHAGKHGVVVDHNGSKVKVFWDEVESVKKPGKHGESTGAPGQVDASMRKEYEPEKPEKEHGFVDPDKAHKALEAAGWEAKSKGITTNSYEHPDHPGHVIACSPGRPYLPLERRRSRVPRSPRSRRAAASPCTRDRPRPSRRPWRRSSARSSSRSSRREDRWPASRRDLFPGEEPPAPSREGRAPFLERDDVLRSCLRPPLIVPVHSVARPLSRLEVVLPEIDVKTRAPIRRGAPQLAALESDVVDVLWLLATTVGAGVRKHEHAVILVDHAALATNVPRKAGMSDRIHVARRNAATRLEPRRHRLSRSPRRSTSLDHRRNHVRSEQSHHDPPFASAALLASSSSFLTTPFSTRRVSSEWS